MEATLNPVGVREAKNNLSALLDEVNKTGQSLTVLKNNKPWAVIQPADAKSMERRRRLEAHKRLMQLVENEPLELREDFDPSKTDKEILGEWRVERFG